MPLSSDTVLTLRLGRLFREQREKLGLSTRQVHEATGLSISNLNRIENGAMPTPSLHTILTLIRFFQLPIETLEGEEPPTSGDGKDERIVHLRILTDSIANQARGQDLDAILAVMQGFLKYLTNKSG